MRWLLKRLPVFRHRFMPLGARGEKLARQFLKRSGYRIIQTNYICPIGEIDIIASDRDVLVFVEVKTRRSDADGDPEEAVNYHKRCKVTKVARYFITQHDAHHMAARFDVIAVLIPDSGRPSITHFADAFPPTPR